MLPQAPMTVAFEPDKRLSASRGITETQKEFPNLNIINCLFLIPPVHWQHFDVISKAVDLYESDCRDRPDPSTWPARIWCIERPSFVTAEAGFEWSIYSDSAADVRRVGLPDVGTAVLSDEHSELDIPFAELVIRTSANGQFRTRIGYLKQDIANDITAPGADYQIYQHTVGGKMYIGITKQTWQKRYIQHLRAAVAGSKYLFHEYMRRDKTDEHCVVAAGLTFDEAMHYEEVLVASSSLYPKGLNMIPGGHAGIRYLHKLGAISLKQAREPKQVDKAHAITLFVAKAHKERRVNPLAAALWSNADFKQRVVCNNPRNFDVDEVRYIRLLHSRGTTVESIAAEMNARPQRVYDLLRGVHYGFIL